MNRIEEAKSYFLKGIKNLEQKSYSLAESDFEKALSLAPDRVSTITNLSAVKLHLTKIDEALTLSERAVHLDPKNVQGYLNLGLIHKEKGNFKKAIKYFSDASNIDPNYLEGFYNCGVTFFALKDYPKAISAFENVLKANPYYDFLLGSLLEAKSWICDWSNYDELKMQLRERIMLGTKASHPFPLLSIFSSGDLLLKASKTWANYTFPHNKDQLVLKHSNAKNSKIRIGYFSADFNNHPIALLTSELFERHDRSQFEIYAFSLRQSDGSSVRKRLEGAFDHFLNVEDLDDLAIAKMSNDLEIDIAVDLGGYTAYSRSEILSHRAAPIQISYLGYLGTMGCNFIDYIIADKFIIPESLQSHYEEKIIYLPNYQANDNQRIKTNDLIKRKDFGIHDSSFVFCCFNNSYKITPSIFDSWMRILNKVDNSILFLYADNEELKTNLNYEAQKRGVDPSRLIFSGRLPMNEYMGRYRACDLFLDTLPYNAGTTASDALGSGLPILTLCGNTFSGRMCSSILNAIGMPELVTYSAEEYESLAIELAINPSKLVAIKNRLQKNLKTTPLFDAHLFTKNLELAYKKVYKNLNSRLPITNIEN